MILPKFEYKRAKSVAEAIALYSNWDGRAGYLAGGTDFIPRVKLRLSTPAVIIDLKGIGELRTIVLRNGWFSVGANVTVFDLKNDAVVKERFPVLCQSLEATACETLQMRGSIGGNILQDTRCLEYNKSLEWRTARGFCYKMGGESCNVVAGAKTCFSNYCSDNAFSLIALSAQVKLVGPEGERNIELEKIYSGNGRTPFVLKPGEVLTEIRIPAEKTRGAYEKLRVRDSMDYPLVGVALSVNGAGARICVGGVGPVPRVYHLEKMDDAAVEGVAQKAYSDAKTVSNTTLSPVYRKKMVGALVRRAIERVRREGK